MVLCLYHVLEQLATSHISVLSIFFEEECIGQSDTALSPTNNAGQLSPPASPLRNTKAAHSTHMNEKKSEKKTTSGSTAAKKKQFPFVSFFAVSLLACSIFLLGLAFATISKLHLQAWGNDETFLTRCVRMDPKDWECSQYLSSWYHNQGNNVELAKYFNEVAIYSLPVEPPRLAMFKASLMIQTPYQVSDSQFVAYQAIHNPQLAKKIVITNNRTHYNNQALACGVVDTVILRLAEKLEERFTALNGSFTMPVELQATTTSADLAFSKIFSIAEMFEKVEKSLIPMIVSNKGNVFESFPSFFIFLIFLFCLL